MIKNKYIIRLIFIFIGITLLLNLKTYFIRDNYNYVFDEVVLNYKNLYDDLKENYDLIKENISNFIYAEVINLPLTKINNLILINKGLKDGIKEDSFVVNKDGLIGIVKKTYNKTSVVRLITSPNTTIAIETNDCFGTLRVKNNQYIINDLINCDKVNINDSVFTSKYNYSSSNILIGRIVDIKNNNIYIKYQMNPYKIRFVGIISENN